MKAMEVTNRINRCSRRICVETRVVLFFAAVFIIGERTRVSVVALLGVSIQFVAVNFILMELTVYASYCLRRRISKQGRVSVAVFSSPVLAHLCGGASWGLVVPFDVGVGTGGKGSSASVTKSSFKDTRLASDTTGVSSSAATSSMFSSSSGGGGDRNISTSGTAISDTFSSGGAEELRGPSHAGGSVVMLSD